MMQTVEQEVTPGFPAYGFASSPLATAEEIARALAQALEGDFQALSEYWRPVVEAEALRLARGSLPQYEDLRQEGYSFLMDWVQKARFRSLVKAVDPTALFQADLRVHLEDLTAKERGGVTLSMNMARLIRRATAVRQRFEAEGKSATPEAIAKALGEPVEEVERALALANWLELDAPVGEDGSARAGEFIPAATPDPAARAEAKVLLKRFLKGLSPEDRALVQEYLDWGWVKDKKERLEELLEAFKAEFAQAA